MALIASGVVLSAGICAAPAEASTINVYAVAYVGSDNNLWYYDGTSGAHDTGIMAPYASPDLGLSKDSSSGAVVGYQVWWQASGSDDPWQYQTSTGLGVNTGTRAYWDEYYSSFVSYAPGVLAST